MLSRVATDGVINGWKNSFASQQTAWRGQGRRLNYGQILPGGARPQDQAVNGPLMPNNPNTFAWTDVYERVDGYGWAASFVATDTGQDWIRTVSSHEGGALTETSWTAYVAA